MSDVAQALLNPAAEAQPLHGEVGVRRFFALHSTAAIFPLSAGVILFGWRALLAVLLVLAGTAVGLAVWKRIGNRGHNVIRSRALWMSLLLALTFPAHLASVTFPGAPTAGWVWPILPTAGLALVMLLWTFAGAGGGRIHVVAIIYLFSVVMFQNLLTPHFVLHHQKIVTGDVIDADIPPGVAAGEIVVPKDAWTTHSNRPRHDAIYTEPASQQLIAFTAGRQTPARTALSLEELLRDDMPPLEDLIIGGHPGPIGSASAVAVIMGGLYLLYRGLIDFRVPLLICISAIIALLLLPIPVVMIDNVPQWQTLIHGHNVGWPVAITFISYELMAGPLLFVAFYLASAPSVRPLTRRGRAVFAIMIGAGTAALQLYLDVSYGAYLALVIVGLFTRLLDAIFQPRPLV